MSKLQDENLDSIFRPHKDAISAASDNALPNYFYLPAWKVALMCMVPFYVALYVWRYSKIFMQRRVLRKNKPNPRLNGFWFKWRLFWRTFFIFFLCYPFLKDVFSGLRRPRLAAMIAIGVLLSIYLFTAYTSPYFVAIFGFLMYLFFQIFVNKSLALQGVSCSSGLACQKLSFSNIFAILFFLFLYAYIFLIHSVSFDSDLVSQWYEQKTFPGFEKVFRVSAPDLYCDLMKKTVSKNNSIYAYRYSPIVCHAAMHQIINGNSGCINKFPLPVNSPYTKQLAKKWALKIYACSFMQYMQTQVNYRPAYVLMAAQDKQGYLCHLRRDKNKNKNTPLAAVQEKKCVTSASAKIKGCYTKIKVTMPEEMSKSKMEYFASEMDSCIA